MVDLNNHVQGSSGGGVPTQITVADESTSETCNVLFTTAAEGDLEPKTNAGFTYNSNTSALMLTGDITAFHSSDKRLKTNIQTIQDPLDKLQKISGYTFEWVPKQGIHSNTGTDTGVIAQEIEEVLPEVTTTRDNGYKAVRYDRMVPLLIECIKSQQEQIQQFEERLIKLEKTNNK